MSVLIEGVRKNSPAYKAGIKPGSVLVSVDGNEINDVLDWQFYGDCGIGLEFGTFLMDKKRGCKNNCVFCFVSQLPKGLRPALYFKDDDSRLSFLQGNYITLTNLSEKDTDRIIKMRTPVNVSVHTTNPELRSFMLGNKNGGAALESFYKLARAGITMNCQIVLCPGINDGQELVRTLADLEMLESVESVAVVPVGLTRFRDDYGLPKLRMFSKEEARDVIAQTERHERAYAADELYLAAELPMPDYGYYGDFPQYENGVGMWAHFKHGFLSAAGKRKRVPAKKRGNAATVSIATGTAAYPLIKELAGDRAYVDIYEIRNDFFGTGVTVSGLLTGRDIISQIKARLNGRDLGGKLLIGANTLNADGLTLDGITPSEIGEALGTEVEVVEVEGEELLRVIMNS